MDSSTVAMLAALVALVALSAYFSATETAFTSLNRIRLKTRADDGDKRAARTLALAADFDRLLSTLLIGNNIVNNVATTIGAVLFIQLIGPGKGPTVSATVLTIVILIFGEVTPKSLAKERPEAWAIVATPLLRVMAVLLTPVNFLFTQWKKLLRVLLRHQDDDGITEEELMGMVGPGRNRGKPGPARKRSHPQRHRVQRHGGFRDPHPPGGPGGPGGHRYHGGGGGHVRRQRVLPAADLSRQY